MLLLLLVVEALFELNREEGILECDYFDSIQIKFFVVDADTMRCSNVLLLLLQLIYTESD